MGSAQIKQSSLSSTSGGVGASACSAIFSARVVVGTVADAVAGSGGVTAGGTDRPLVLALDPGPLDDEPVRLVSKALRRDMARDRSEECIEIRAAQVLTGVYALYDHKRVLQSLLVVNRRLKRNEFPRIRSRPSSHTMTCRGSDTRAKRVSKLS